MKTLIRNNFFYANYIRPLRAKYNRFVESRLNDESYFIRRHKKIFGYIPDFKHPKTFNEKIINRILYDRNPIYSALADKLKARIYIAHKLGGQQQDSHSSALKTSKDSNNLASKIPTIQIS